MLPLRFRIYRSNPHDINHGKYPILLPWVLTGWHYPALATYTPNSNLPVSPFLADFHIGTAKNYHPTTTVIQQEPAATRDSPTFPPHSILPHSHPKGTCSFDRHWCYSLNKIRAFTELLVKTSSVDCHLFFPHVNHPTTIPPKKYIAFLMVPYSPLPPQLPASRKKGQETHESICQ